MPPQTSAFNSSMEEILAFAAIEQCMILLGFTFLALQWGQLVKQQHLIRRLHHDRSKYITFLCLGMMWLSIFLTRSLWDYINFSYVAYVDGKRTWAKEVYTWIQRNLGLVNSALAILNNFKLAVTTLAFGQNLIRWAQIGERESLTKKFQAFILVDIIFAVSTTFLTLALGPISGGSWLYTGYE